MTLERSISSAQSGDVAVQSEAGAGPAPFQLSGSSYNLLTLRVITPEAGDFFMLLGKTVSQSPEFYRNAPVVLDLAPIVDRVPFNMAEFVRRLRQHQLHPVGVVNGNDAWNKVASNAGLGLFLSGRPARLEAREPVRSPNGERAGLLLPAIPSASATRYVTDPVRSGQQVYAKGGDLVVLAPVSHGAELIADGNIHVWGTLRGRALAGASGDVKARILCRNLDPELVSIAGIYAVRDAIGEDSLHKPAQVMLDGETILIEPIP
ncbi:septum site-determining protein MinC [Telmatospirillum sp. J64-1]|uniref:septum site-determining protein MinC n=1 Tax=Telmatospirillum sp. J64-1 TaxID=2502183 RepID=UPI00115F5CA8|nr:septum site-determining protein MinC [Telmatospirillum sp. J64-1]